MFDVVAAAGVNYIPCLLHGTNKILAGQEERIALCTDKSQV
jgi:hypothetical protein